MKIKNNNERGVFSFEDIKIEPEETIEVDSVVGQRLLSLFWHNPLEIIEEQSETTQVETPQVNVDVVDENTPNEQEVEVKKSKKVVKQKKVKK